MEYIKNEQSRLNPSILQIKDKVCQLLLEVLILKLELAKHQLIILETSSKLRIKAITMIQ